MKKFIVFIFLFVPALFIFPPKAFAQLRLTTPQAVTQISVPDLSSSVAEDAQGNINVFRVSPGTADPNNPDSYRVFQSTFNSGTGSFDAPVQVTNLTRVSEVKALKDSTGALNLIIVKFTYPDSGRYDLYWTQNSGSGWTAPVKLTDYEGADTQATLTETGNGNLAVVFLRRFLYDKNGNFVSGPTDPNYDHADTDLYQMFYTNGVWSTPTAIDTTPFTSEAYPTIAKGPGTTLYLVYSSNVNGSWSILWRTYDTSTSTWSTPTTLDSGVMGGYLQQPSIINDMNGKYRLVYAKKTLCPNDLCPNYYSNYNSEIMYKTYDSTTNIWATNPVALTDKTQFYADNPAAFFDSKGNYWLVYKYVPQTSWGGDTLNVSLNTYWQKSLPNTAVGSNIFVDLGSDSSITFSGVTKEGTTTLDTSTTNPGNITGVFKVGNYYYDISSNAEYTGPMDITLRYNDEGMTPSDESNLKIFHWLSTEGRWEDATQSVDTVNNIVHARVTSLSWIMIGKVAPKVTWLGPISNIVDGSIYTFNDGSTLPIPFNLTDMNGKFIYDSRVKVKVSGNGGEATFVIGDGTDNIRYDSTTGQYIVNLHTKNYSWIIPGPIYNVEVSSDSIPGTTLGTTSFTTLEGGKAQKKN